MIEEKIKLPDDLNIHQVSRSAKKAAMIKRKKLNKDYLGTTLEKAYSLGFEIESINQKIIDKEVENDK